MPTPIHFPAGTSFFREGDRSDVVFRLVSGRAVIQRAVGGQAVILGYVQPGEFIGEMGVIEDLPRIASAVAETKCEAESLTVDEFFDRISNENTSARELILRLCARLRQADDRLAQRSAEQGTEPAFLPGSTRYDMAVCTIAAGTRKLRALIGDDPISVTALPFVVGRTPEAHETKPRYACQLEIAEKTPFRISRNHFSIEGVPGHLYVRDLDSTLGTTVNGHTIGHHFRTDRYPLQSGANTIVAGGHDSPNQFNVTVS